MLFLDVGGVLSKGRNICGFTSEPVQMWEHVWKMWTHSFQWRSLSSVQTSSLKMYRGSI
jgi:hypothetical protein